GDAGSGVGGVAWPTGLASAPIPAEERQEDRARYQSGGACQAERGGPSQAGVQPLTGLGQGALGAGASTASGSDLPRRGCRRRGVGNGVGGREQELLHYLHLTEKVCGTARRRVLLGETVANEEKL